jgi:hypothetical protein
MNRMALRRQWSIHISAPSTFDGMPGPVRTRRPLKICGKDAFIARRLLAIASLGLRSMILSDCFLGLAKDNVTLTELE